MAINWNNFGGGGKLGRAKKGNEESEIDLLVRHENIIVVIVVEV